MTVTSFPPVNTQEIYNFRPGSTKVHRNTHYETGHSPPGAMPVTGRWLRAPKPARWHAELLSYRRLASLGATSPVRSAATCSSRYSGSRTGLLIYPAMETHRPQLRRYLRAVRW